MRILAGLLCVMAVSGATAQAWAVQASSDGKPVVVYAVDLPTGCPVGMNASHQESHVRALTAAGWKSATERSWTATGGEGTSTRVSLVAPAGKAFLRAEVEVDYTLPASKLLPARADMGVGGDSQREHRRFSLRAADPAGSARLERRLALGVTGRIVRVRLVSATYTDGTELARVPGCAVLPDPLLLVAGK